MLASGTTAIAGFAVLVVSDIKMLRDFGFVTVVDLTVALLGVMVVLPAVLLLAEQGRLRLRGAAGAAGAASTRSAPRPGERAQASALPAAPPLRLVRRASWAWRSIAYVVAQHAAHRQRRARRA